MGPLGGWDANPCGVARLDALVNPLQLPTRFSANAAQPGSGKRRGHGSVSSVGIRRVSTALVELRFLPLATAIAANFGSRARGFLLSMRGRKHSELSD